MTDGVELERLIGEYPSLLVGYSGGVDSALVAVVARRVLGEGRVLAALGVSPSLSTVQRGQAHAIAEHFGVALLEVETRELDDPRYRANAPDRCYHCKHTLWDTLGRVAAERGLAVVADGTNTDDLHGHRPGARAAREFGVRSPLAEVGYTKADVRAHARALGLPVWDAPAAPCLSSRVLYGLEVTPARLRQVEQGEAFLRGLGVTGDLRVRHRGAEARLETAPTEFARIRAERERVATCFFALGFDRVTLDLRGYRSGSLLGSPDGDVELLAARH